MTDWNPSWGDHESLAHAIAQAPYNKPGSCPWVAVAPLAQMMLQSRASSFLADSIPVLLEAGWTPPKDTP